MLKRAAPLRALRAARAVGASALALAFLRCAEGEVTREQCQDWSQEASSGRRAAQDAADAACLADGDCVIVDYALACFADCGYPSSVARAGVPALEASVAALDARVCRTYDERGCPEPPSPRCLPPPGSARARCDAGRCTLEWEIPP